MNKLPNKPAGSIIEEEVDFEGVTLRWALPASGVTRYACATVLAFWLCGWAASWIRAVPALIAAGPPLFVIGWLGVWTLGGACVIWMLWGMLRPARPESVRLEAEWLRYDPGRSPMYPFQRIWMRPVKMPRVEISGCALERVGGRQRLSVDCGADRVEIGPCLREAEREWLHTVLQMWHSPTLNAAAGRTTCFSRRPPRWWE